MARVGLPVLVDSYRIVLRVDDFNVFEQDVLHQALLLVFGLDVAPCARPVRDPIAESNVGHVSSRADNKTVSLHDPTPLHQDIARSWFNAYGVIAISDIAIENMNIFSGDVNPICVGCHRVVWRVDGYS